MYRCVYIYVCLCMYVYEHTHMYTCDHPSYFIIPVIWKKSMDQSLEKIILSTQ